MDQPSMAIIERAAKEHRFSCEQASRILNVMVYAPEKLEALRLLAPRLVDRHNIGLLLGHFTPSREHEVARRLLSVRGDCPGQPVERPEQTPSGTENSPSVG